MRSLFKRSASRTIERIFALTAFFFSKHTNAHLFAEGTVWITFGTSAATFHQHQKRLKHFASLALIANPRVKTRTGRPVLNEVLQRPQVTCSETGQGKKINLKSTLCALLKHLSLQQSPVRKNSGHAHNRKASSGAARRKSLEPTGVKRTESRARNKPNEEERRGDCPGIHGVIKGLSGGAHPAGDRRCADWRLQR